jgi:arylsulfatase A-like enzyme
MPRPINSNGGTLGAAMGGQTRSLFETWRLSAFGQSLSTERKAREFGEAVERAKAVAADPAYGFVVIHLLTPHFPHAYDRTRDAFTLGNAPLRGYYDSLALTDRVWAQLRRSMEDAGVWEGTAVLLTSDHAMKHSELLDGKKDSRVPFLLKLPGPSRGRDYTLAFDTVVTGELLLEALDGGVSSADEAMQWLDQRREGADE